MHTLKTCAAAFVGALAALFAYEAINQYRKPGPDRLAVDVRPVPEQPTYRNGEQVRKINTYPGQRERGSIEWTDKPDTKRLIP